MKKAVKGNYAGWLLIAFGFGCLIVEPSSETFQELMPWAAFFNFFIGLLSFPLYKNHLKNLKIGRWE